MFSPNLAVPAADAGGNPCMRESGRTGWTGKEPRNARSLDYDLISAVGDSHAVGRFDPPPGADRNA